MSVFNHKQSNNIILAILIVLGCFLLYAMHNLFNSILGAIVLYTIFRPVYFHFVRKKRWKKSLVALSIIFISFIVIIIPILSVSVMVYNKIGEIKSQNFPVKEWLSKIDAFAGSNLNQPNFIDNINIGEKLGTFATQLFPSIVSSASDIFITLLVLYFILYYMLTQNDEFETNLVKYAPFPTENTLKFATELRNATYSNVIGQGIISLSQGILFTIGLRIIDFPDPVFWGVIGTLISFLPVIGVPSLALLFSVIMFLNNHPWKGFFLFAYGFVLIIYIDNFLRFFINKRLANTHPLITVIGVIIGIPLFGILGLVFGPVLLSYFILLFEIYETNIQAEEKKTILQLEASNDK